LRDATGELAPKDCDDDALIETTGVMIIHPQN